MQKNKLTDADFAIVVEKLRQDPKAKSQMIRMDAVALGAAIVKDARSSAGLSQLQLARRMGVSQPRISSIERADGTDGPTLAMLLRVADACGLELQLNFREKSKMKPAPPTEVIGCKDEVDSDEDETGVIVSFPTSAG